MIVRLNWTEWQLRKAADALETLAEGVDPDDLEQLLVLSSMRLDLLQAAEESLNLDRQAIRQEYGI
jgi:hypothetical protein